MLFVSCGGGKAMLRTSAMAQLLILAPLTLAGQFGVFACCEVEPFLVADDVGKLTFAQVAQTVFWIYKMIAHVHVAVMLYYKIIRTEFCHGAEC